MGSPMGVDQVTMTGGLRDVVELRVTDDIVGRSQSKCWTICHVWLVAYCNRIRWEQSVNEQWNTDHEWESSEYLQF